MGEPMKFSTDGLTQKQISVLKSLGTQMSSKGFYLAGGTALAIHLSHRVSVDLDWFTPHSFADGMRREPLALQFKCLYGFKKHKRQ